MLAIVIPLSVVLGMRSWVFVGWSDSCGGVGWCRWEPSPSQEIESVGSRASSSRAISGKRSSLLVTTLMQSPTAALD